MRIYGGTWLKAGVVDKLLQTIHRGEFDGTMTSWAKDYLESQKAFHAPTGSLLIVTRDTGHHRSGWFKNPEFERCVHFSISFREPFNMSKQADFDRNIADEWASMIFVNAMKLIWIESAKSAIGKKLEVLHYRVFCDMHWQPIHPHGEVYSTELTEKGWQSWSDLHPGIEEPSSLYAG